MAVALTQHPSRFSRTDDRIGLMRVVALFSQKSTEPRIMCVLIVNLFTFSPPGMLHNALLPWADKKDGRVRRPSQPGLSRRLA